MKQLKHISIISALTLFAFINNSCKTDFELNAPYDEIPVIFGILDQSVDTQFVKINKSFIGTGDNVTYAAINDSSLYTNVVGTVEEYIDNSLTRTFNLQEKWVSNLDAGIFYTDSQKVFFFVPSPKLDENATYKLIVNTAEEAEPITSETDMIIGSDLNFTPLFSNASSQFGVQFAGATTLETGKYLTETPSWLTVVNGKKYELKIRMYYDEVTATSTQEKFIEWNLGTQEAINLNGGEKLLNQIGGESFYDAIANKLKNYVYEADVIKRVVRKRNLEFIIVAANDNLNTFMALNEPATGIVTERAEFTNIEGGVGIFASRYTTKITTLLDSHSFNVLCNGPKTSAYKFCVDSIFDVGLSGLDYQTTYNNGLVLCPAITRVRKVYFCIRK